MKVLLGLGLLFVIAGSICAAESSGFAVDLVNPSRAYLLVDDAWQRNAECLQVKVSVAAEVTDPVLKAYFYGTDGKLIETEKAPSRQTDDQGNETRPQKKFEKGRKYEFFFGIPDAAKKWKRVIIVFGKPGDYATKVYPKDDLAKFDFPEKASAVVSAVPPPQATAVPAPEKPAALTRARSAVPGKPTAQVQALKAPFDAQVNAEVEQVYDAGVKDLNQKYATALERAQEKAQESAKLEDAVAIKADRESVAAGRGVPATDDENTPDVVKQLRSTYRQAIVRLETERARKLQPLQASFLKSLDEVIINLTKDGKLDEALAVRNDRENLAADFAEPRHLVVLGQTVGEAKPVLTAKATIPSNNPDGYKFGPISKGDVITLKYLEGRWKNHGVIASFNPDDPATGDASRLVIAMPSKSGIPGDVVVVVPPSTVLTPFDFKSPIASDQLVLRINADSNNAGNPGAVVYQLEVKRISPSSAPPPTTSAATVGNGTPFVNSLGMKFVAIPGTEVLMCIHETRRKDYAAFASANSRTDDGWKQAVDRGMPVGRGDDEPVVMVNFEDATAFCAWLGQKEGKRYRLPTDREWSLAVGIGDRESPNATPLSLNEKIRDEFPWGKAWPPPKGSVNLRDSSCGNTFPSANGVSNVEDYTDGFVTTAPVMSFTPNGLGIYDLAGNVWEWCSDWFEEDKGTHVMRGGNYGSIRGGVLSSYRIGGSAARTPGRGFRCVVVSQNAAGSAQKAGEGTVMESEDLVVTGKKFTEGTLKNKETVYGNRGYVWWKVPKALSGARYTKLEGGVRPEIKVRAKRDTVVQIFNQPSDPGVDLSGWEQTEQLFTYNTPKWPDVVVYTRKLSAGQEVEIPQGNWGGTAVLLPPSTTTASTSASAKSPELPWLVGKTWATDAGNTLEFADGGAGARTTKSGKTPFTWRIMPSGLVEVVLKAPPPLTLYVEFKSASEGVFGTSETKRTVPIHVK